MADNPYATNLMNPNVARMGMYDMRMMSAANRMESPYEHFRTARSSSPWIGGGQGDFSGGTDFSQFTYDPEANAAARAAGVMPLEASQVRQNMILPNSGFFGRHPRLSAALEGGIFGGLAAHGGNTVGESIQGALEGLVGGKQMRQNMYNRQFAQPFEAAGVLERLNDMHQKRDLQEAEIQHYRAMNEKLGRPDKDFRALGVNKNDQSIMMYDATTGENKMIANPDFDPALVRNQRATQDLDIGTREQLMIMGVTPGAASPSQIAEANRKSQGQAVERAGAFRGAQNSASLPYENYKEARTQHDRRLEDLNKQMAKINDPTHRQWAENQILDQRYSEQHDKTFYKQNPNYLLAVDPKDTESYISKYNEGIQSKIDEESSAFSQKWPQTLESPRIRKASPKSKPSKVPTYNPQTGQLE